MQTDRGANAVRALRIRPQRNRLTAGLVLPAILAAFMSAALPGSARAVDIWSPAAVVELFTSQGCSSCPPADKVLSELNSGHRILGLSMHVDYWDRLGWKDTFASPENTKRQWEYARALGERQVYTPQAVVNGQNHVVGSRKSNILSSIRSQDENDAGLSVPIVASVTDGVLHVRVDGAMTPDSTLYAVYFDPRRDVEVKRGENAGRTITYSNIVRRVEMLSMTGADGIDAEFKISDMEAKGYKGCALILQQTTGNGLPGAILGATVLSDL